MLSKTYSAQADLMLQVMPFVAKEECFALKGGTAINFFVRELPRLSVDIDLTYLPFEDRPTSLSNISSALSRVKTDAEKSIPGTRITPTRQSDGQEVKLLCQNEVAQIKIEVNTTIRGHLYPTRWMRTTKSVEDAFGKFARIQVISEAELFGGKICAALDRQHPRDLFDVYLLLANQGFSEPIRYGFLSLLLSTSRPINELLQPNWVDQLSVFETQFSGMTMLPFTYADYLKTRETLLKTIHSSLTQPDREFLISFKSGDPAWEMFPEARIQDLPSVQWKLMNIQKLMTQNPKKHAQQLQRLKETLHL